MSNQFLEAYLKLIEEHKIDAKDAASVVKKAVGTKRALLIGINYFGQNGELHGCHNDVDNMRQYLKENGYTEFTVLKDSRADPKFELSSAPTRDNIISQLKSHIAKTRRGDTLYVHYSGHGSYIRDTSGDELDGRDECICPVDFSGNPYTGAGGGFIIDDDLWEIIRQIKPGAKLRICFDSCHSGTAIDLPFRWVSGTRMVAENANKLQSDIVFISGCADAQTSADAFINGAASGAMTHALLDALWDIKKSGKHASTWTWVDLVSMMRTYLRREHYDQVPQLSLCDPDDCYKYVDL